MLGLDRNGLMCLTLLALASNPWTIATALSLSVDLTYDPEAGYTWWDKHGLKVLLHALSIVVGVIMLATGNPGGVLMILSGTIGLVGELFNEQLAGAMGKAMLGIQTILIGLKSLSCCTPFGLIAMAVGAACVAFATAEAQESLGYGNWMKDTGMSDGWYTGLMTAANVAAIAINIIGPKCFKEGTLVLTEDGYKKIEEIEVGDKVLAYDEETGKQGYKPVVQLFRNESTEWTGVTVNGTEIISTPGHKYFLPETKAWVAAANLKVGTKVLLSDGTYGIIEAVADIRYDTPQTTYNFEVEGFHTYYVGDGVLVHNKGCGFSSETVAGPEDVGRYKDVRIDVEVGGSGKTNIHMQARGLKKMYYDTNLGTFPTAPRKLRENSFVQKGISKALDLIKRRG